MPNISIATPEINASIIRPSILSIVNQIIDITKIPKDTRILYPDYIQAVYQKGSTINQATEQKDRTSLSFSNQLLIEVDMTYDEGNILATAIKRPENLPVFNDDKIGVFVKPIYSKNNFVINIRYKSTSPTEGKRWRDSIRMHISNMRDINLHDINYHFIIPDEVIAILREIHRCREQTNGYDQDFQTYLSAHGTTKLTSVTNQTGKNKNLSVAEKQMRIQGLFDFDIAPEKGEIDSEGHAWITTFSYKLSFDVPIGINIKYPIMVHNQLLNEPYISYEEKAYDLDDVSKAYTLSLGSLSHFEITNQNKSKNEIIRIPEFDNEFMPSSMVHGTQPIFTALCSLDNDLRILLNLNELGDFVFDSDIMDFIKSEFEYMTIPYKSIFNVSLYRFSALSSDTKIKVDSQLNVMSKDIDLDTRVNHRVMFSIVKDLRLLTRKELKRLYDHKAAAIKILQSLNVNRGVLNSIAHHVNFNSYLPNAAPSGSDLRQLQMSYYQFNTVNVSSILSHRKQPIEQLRKLGL